MEFLVLGTLQLSSSFGGLGVISQALNLLNIEDKIIISSSRNST